MAVVAGPAESHDEVTTHVKLQALSGGRDSIQLLDAHDVEHVTIATDPSTSSLAARKLLIRGCESLVGIEFSENSAGEACQNLQIVVVEGTRLQAINEAIFSMGKSIATLTVVGNILLKKLPRLDSYPFRSLELLDLSDNSLESLPDALFANTSCLRRVRLCGNRLCGIPEGLGNSGATLVHLDVSRNTQLEQLPADTGRLRALTELRLDGCSAVRGLPLGMDGCTALRLLSAEGAGLQHVPVGALSELLELRELRLDGCPLAMHRGAGGLGEEGGEEGAGAGSEWLDPVSSSAQAQAFAGAVPEEELRAEGAEAALGRAGRMGFVLGERSLRGGLVGVGAGGSSLEVAGGGASESKEVFGARPEGGAGAEATGEGLAHGLLRSRRDPAGASASLWSVQSVRRAGFGLDEAQAAALAAAEGSMGGPAEGSMEGAAEGAAGGGGGGAPVGAREELAVSPGHLLQAGSVLSVCSDLRTASEAARMLGAGGAGAGGAVGSGGGGGR